MSPEHEAHLLRIKEKFLTAVDVKYRLGQEEHGGNLWTYHTEALLLNALEELVDAFVYTQTALDQLQQLTPLVVKPDNPLGCHCARTFRYEFDKMEPTGKTLVEIR